jgi:hypothetical protein
LTTHTVNVILVEMKANILFLIVGILLGGLVAGLAFYSTSSSPQPKAAAISSSPPKAPALVAKSKTDSSDLEKELASLKEENAKLTAQLKEAAEKSATNSSRRQGQRENWGRMAAEFANQQIDTQLATLKLRLKLTDAQEAALKASLESQRANIQNFIAQGNFSRDEIQKFTDEQKAIFEAQLKQTSTPEQVTEYEKYKTEQKQTQNEIQANNDLLRLNQRLNLTQKQQDDAFKVLYQDQENRSNTSITREDRQAATKASLQKILTPDQFKLYEQQQEAQQQQQEARRRMWDQMRQNNSSGNNSTTGQ